MLDTAVAPPPDRLEQAGLFALFGVAGAVEFSIAAAQILLAVALLSWLAMLATGRVRFAAPRRLCLSFYVRPMR